MLVLSRDIGESMKIVDQETGQTMEIKILRQSGRRLKIGFSGPQKFKVIRDELETEDQPSPQPSSGVA